LDYLSFDLSEGDAGVTTREALASTSAAQHAAVMAEAQQVLDWAWRQFPRTHGPAEDGNDWDHDLQVSVEDGGWHAVTLTLTGSAEFVEAFQAQFG
jgi:hypothetical protein